MNDKEMVNHPSHYNKGKLEAIKVIEDWDLDFCLGNAVKYIARCKYKRNKKEDLEKAIWYLQHEIDKDEEKKNTKEETIDKEDDEDTITIPLSKLLLAGLLDALEEE